MAPLAGPLRIFPLALAAQPPTLQQRSRAAASQKTACNGNASDKCTHTRLAVTFTRAPIFDRRERIVTPCARAISVPAKPIRRNALTRT